MSADPPAAPSPAAASPAAASAGAPSPSETNENGAAWRPRTAVGIAGLFFATAVVYWFVSNFVDPAGTILFVFMAGSMGFGFWVLFKGVRGL